MKNYKNVLIIIDPQVDFIKGSLAVDGAVSVIRNLSKDLQELVSKLEINHIVVTQDSHPEDHCSFTEFPPHCIYGTDGWEIDSRLDIELYDVDTDLYLFEKGEEADVEEFSFLDNPDNREYMIQLLKPEVVGSIYVCGIAGDYCVLSTLKDLESIYQWSTIKVLPDYIVSIDGGEKLNKYIQDNKIQTYKLHVVHKENCKNCRK